MKKTVIHFEGVLHEVVPEGFSILGSLQLPSYNLAIQIAKFMKFYPSPLYTLHYMGDDYCITTEKSSGEIIHLYYGEFRKVNNWQLLLPAR